MSMRRTFVRAKQSTFGAPFSFGFRGSEMDHAIQMRSSKLVQRTVQNRIQIAACRGTGSLMDVAKPRDRCADFALTTTSSS